MTIPACLLPFLTPSKPERTHTHPLPLSQPHLLPSLPHRPPHPPGQVCQGRFPPSLPHTVPPLTCHYHWSIGRPIHVKKFAKGAPGYDAEVDRVHALVVTELQGLYDRHKAEYGWQDRPLVIH